MWSKLSLMITSLPDGTRRLAQYFAGARSTASIRAFHEISREDTPYALTRRASRSSAGGDGEPVIPPIALLGAVLEPVAQPVRVQVMPDQVRGRRLHVRRLGPEPLLTFSSLAASFASVAPCRNLRCPFSVNTARHGSPPVSGG